MGFQATSISYAQALGNFSLFDGLIKTLISQCYAKCTRNFLLLCNETCNVSRICKSKLQRKPVENVNTLLEAKNILLVVSHVIFKILQLFFQQTRLQLQ